MSSNYGPEFAIIANKSTKQAHAAYPASEGQPAERFCYADKPAAGALGRTVVATVDGYQGIVEYGQQPNTYALCADCAEHAASIQADHEKHLAQVAAEGPAAGRTIRHTLVVTEVVSEEATLYSIKNAEENMRHRLEQFLAAEGATLTVEFVEES